MVRKRAKSWQREERPSQCLYHLNQQRMIWTFYLSSKSTIRKITSYVHARFHNTTYLCHNPELICLSDVFEFVQCSIRRPGHLNYHKPHLDLHLVFPLQLLKLFPCRLAYFPSIQSTQQNFFAKQSIMSWKSIFQLQLLCFPEQSDKCTCRSCKSCKPGIVNVLLFKKSWLKPECLYQ